jgi:hypothetical protein
MAVIYAALVCSGHGVSPSSTSSEAGQGKGGGLKAWVSAGMLFDRASDCGRAESLDAATLSRHPALDARLDDTVSISSGGTLPLSAGVVGEVAEFGAPTGTPDLLPKSGSAES